MSPGSHSLDATTAVFLIERIDRPVGRVRSRWSHPSVNPKLTITNVRSGEAQAIFQCRDDGVAQRLGFAPTRTAPDFRGITPASLFHDSILARVQVSGNPGAVPFLLPFRTIRTDCGTETPGSFPQTHRSWAVRHGCRYSFRGARRREVCRTRRRLPGCIGPSRTSCLSHRRL